MFRNPKIRIKSFVNNHFLWWKKITQNLYSRHWILRQKLNTRVNQLPNSTTFKHHLNIFHNFKSKLFFLLLFLLFKKGCMINGFIPAHFQQEFIVLRGVTVSLLDFFLPFIPTISFFCSHFGIQGPRCEPPFLLH